MPRPILNASVYGHENGPAYLLEWKGIVRKVQSLIPLIENPLRNPIQKTRNNPSHASTLHSARLCQVLLFSCGNVHLVAEVVSSLLLHNDECKHKNVEVERTRRVDAKTCLELAFKYTIRDV